MNLPTSLLTRCAIAVTLLSAAPLMAEAGTCEDSPARCTRPPASTTRITSTPRTSAVRPVAVVARVVPAPAASAPAKPAVVAPAPVLAKRVPTNSERIEKPVDRPAETKVPAVPGLGTLIRMSTGTHEEISWFSGPRDRRGAILT